MADQERIPNPRRLPWVEALGVALIAAGIVWFYGYLATSHGADSFDRGPGDYYGDLVDAFLGGHTYFKALPPPQLAALPNPYDPTARVRIGQPGWADISYYKGRYYFYFGVAPAIVLFLPFELLTGLYFPETVACALFCSGGFLASMALFLSVRRRWFPECPATVIWLGTLMLGLGNFCTIMLTRAVFYEVPISCAYCFSILGLGLLHSALFGRSRRGRKLWLASVCFGVAVGSRPHFIFGSAALGVAGIFLWREKSSACAPGWRRVLAWDAVALVLPVALTVVGLLIYNYERFDSPFNFGQKLQLAGYDQLRMTYWSWRFIPINIYYYFLAPAHWGRYFPFVRTVSGYFGRVPKSYYGAEDPFGLLPNLPCSWLAFAAPVLWFARYRRNSGLGLTLLMCGAVFVPVCLFMLLFVSATNRYFVDFLPCLLLIAAIGLLMVGVAGAGHPWRQLMLRASLAVAVVFSASFNVMAAFQHNGLFQHHQPAAFERLARWFNRPAGWWDRIHNVPFGPVELTLRLPRQSLGRTEPLVVTGEGDRTDYVYLYYRDGGSVQIGYSHGGAPGVTSQPIAVNYDATHRIGIAEGSLYPRSSHPYFSRWSSDRIAEARHELRVTVDGVPYLEATEDFDEARPETTSFGRNPFSDFGGRAFGGQILGVRRANLEPALVPLQRGSFVRLAFVLPSDPPGAREPLVGTGRTGAADLIFAVCDDDRHIRLGFSQPGVPPLLSAPLALAPGQIQLLEASLGSFYRDPQSAAERELARALIVRFNGQLIWAREQDFLPGGPPVIGANPWNSPDCAASFSGRIVAVQPMANPLAAGNAAAFAFDSYWIEAPPGQGYGALRLHFDLPRPVPGGFEPLLVTGPSAQQADYVWILYHDPARIEFGYEHTGGGGPPSGAIEIDAARSHVIEMSVPSLYPPLDDGYFAGWPLLEALASKSRVRLRLDGVLRLDADVKAYASDPAQSAVGENRVSSTFGKKFTGRIWRIERATRTLPPGFRDQTGPLELALTWPNTPPVGRSEALLSTGSDSARDSLLVSYEEGSLARWVVRDHSGRTLSSAPWPLAPGGQAVVRIAWGGFYPDGARPASILPAAWHSRQRSFSIGTPGSGPFRGSADFVLAEPEQVGIGSAPSPAPFSGVIRSLRRLPAAAP